MVASQVAPVVLAVEAEVSGSHGSYHRVERQGVGDKAAVAGVRGGDAGVVVSVGLSLGVGISFGFSLGLALLASEVNEGSRLVEGANSGGDHSVGERGVDKGGVVEDWVGHHLVTHLSWLLNYRLDKGSVGHGVSNRESEGGVGKQRGGGHKMGFSQEGGGC